MRALPIDPLLPELASTLAREGCVVLQAPPGAGKTTRVPPALLGTIPGKILMLEPRRLAAHGAALRIAEEIGEKPGQTVGYRMRGDSVPGARIEIVTEGILTRMIQSDAELSGIGCVIFDEFHERSLHADLGLALTWEVRQALREDLKIVGSRDDNHFARRVDRKDALPDRNGRREIRTTDTLLPDPLSRLYVITCGDPTVIP